MNLGTACQPFGPEQFKIQTDMQSQVIALKDC